MKHIPKIRETGAGWQWQCTCGRTGTVTRHRGNAARGAMMHANARRRHERYEAVAQFGPTGDVVVYDGDSRVDIPAGMVPAVRALLAHGSTGRES
ncbi:hypothetical protein [Microbacterium sp. CSI-V]|uniref:hypothetical protein n=1 Tax=Microbacterium sp. CSI-V TaxID=1933777 RepID=UPI00111587CE|nr:hypothetical protein [Microbacterium sp. CSI-V]